MYQIHTHSDTDLQKSAGAAEHQQGARGFFDEEKEYLTTKKNINNI